MTQANPVGRIHIIDAIRGLAVLGILFANIHSWSGYKFITFTEISNLAYFQYDSLFLKLHYWLVDGKFYAIFSILFGAGFGLQYVKNQANQPPFIKTYRKRLSFLLVFGIVHSLCWSGDILTLYALLAFVLVLLRNIETERLLPLALALLGFFALPQILMLLFAEPQTAKMALAHKTYSDMLPAQLTSGFGEGTVVEAFLLNLHNLYWRWLDFLPNGRVSRVLGLFVLGFYLARSGYFVAGIYSLKRLAIYLALGLGLTALARLTDTNISKWAVSEIDILLKVALVAGQVFLALAYMSLLAQLFNRKAGEVLLFPLTLIGRMAFTNYLAQTLIGICIFYGIGLGLWGTFGLMQLWGLALVIYAAQVLLSSVWLTYYKQGPVEWFWGGLTRGEFRSNRRVSV